MTIEIIEGDLLDAFDKGEVNVIGHVVNCQGVMGSGIAKSIRDRYSNVYQCYKDLHSLTTNSSALLGTCQLVSINKLTNTTVANLFAQHFYGQDGRRYLNYGALGEALWKLEDQLVDNTLQKRGVVGFPYKMGADRAGGSWDIVFEMIKHYFKYREVKIYRLSK